MDERVDMEARALYDTLLAAWNRRSADDYAALFADDGEMIGYDGSTLSGRASIAEHLGAIFAHHRTPHYLAIVRGVRLLGPGAAVLRAITGLVPDGQRDINLQLNAHQTLACVWRADRWQIALFQNTPAQFHGRPDLADAMTTELRELLA